MKSRFRKLLLALAGLGIVGAIGYGLVPEPVMVDFAMIETGDIRVTVDQDGKTRIRERYVVSTPLAGRLLRIDLDPGDEVVAGETLIATIEPRDPELLDARSIALAEARVKAAAAALEKMKPVLEEALAGQEFTAAELARVKDARRKAPQSVSISEVESKELAYRTRSALLRTATKSKEIARFELDQSRAALIRSRPHANGPPVEAEADASQDSWDFTIRSPIDGRVLRVFQESSAVIAAGTALVELGDPTDLEVEIDVLSRDAVRIRPEALVLFEHWGGDKPLHGRVRLVEPSAFTKISTLGVEEQRVNIIVSLVDLPEERTALGDGFRVEARIVVAEADEVLKVPTSALFRVGQEWAVFRVVAGVAQQQMVKLGLRNGLAAEVVEGLQQGDLVVVHPGDKVAEGIAVARR
ncbi:MAG: HlyD family efflux transporter periplasmic adaptor subunit [Planctomycetes bacterium]|nr:HlyD family efflux transporter periplasmic adaptor subunit [Planctomycetota bacterium]